MHNQSQNTETGIIVPTMNRPDFLIRMLNYYADLGYKHTIYIGDSSNPENADIIQNEIAKLKNKLKINYQTFYDGDGIECIKKLLSTVKEKYVTFIGDDDYSVPDTIYACAEFLEKNPDYETATGKSVTIRMKNGQAHGELTEIHDYPRYSIEDDTASDRLYHHLAVHFNSIIASVLPTKNMLKYYQAGSNIKDSVVRGEILPCSLMVIAGKSKVLDRIGLVRQIHSQNLRNADIFDEIMHQDWPKSYAMMSKVLETALIEQDEISQQIATDIVKKCFWANLKDQFTAVYPQYVALISPHTTQIRTNKNNLKNKIARRFPSSRINSSYIMK
jgi:glycosyltransferase domain-containing protein